MIKLFKSLFIIAFLLVTVFAFKVKAGMHVPVKGKTKIMMVVRINQKSHPTDVAMAHRLDSLGYQVTMVNQDEPTSSAAKYDLVLISATIGSRDFGDRYKSITTPILTWENDILDDMSMTGKRKDIDFGAVDKEHYLWFVNAPHPLSTGFSAGMNYVYPRDKPMGWGKPGLGATIIATLPGQPDKAAIFAYEKGATMDYDFVAPARRIFFFLDNDTFTDLTPAGLKLFDAAVKWATGI